MDTFVAWMILFALTVIAVAAWCRRMGWPAPLVLTVVGLVASYLPWIPHEPLEPDLILVGLLPPLLYAAAVQVSLIDIRREWRAIGVLSVGLVVATTVVVGLVGWWLLPVSLAATLALGSVVAPPDAVAATAVGRRIGLPRRVVTVLEGESLVNDATAIVLLHTTAAAIVGTVTALDLGVAFLLSVVGGVIVGVLVAFVVGQIYRRVDDTVTATAISFVTPWLAYLPAEEIHGSGVLAVVIAGLVIAHKAPLQQTATARLGQKINWTTIQFFLENSVFLLGGLQLSLVVRGAQGSAIGWGRIVALCLVVLAVVVLLRPLWVFAWAWLLNTPDATGARMTAGDLGVVSWAGMRGVVTLAAVLSLPLTTPNREVLVLVAMVVVAGTLLGQGPTLPWVARRLGVRGPDARADVLQTAQVMRSAVSAGLRELDALEADPDRHVDPDAVRDLRERADRQANTAWEELRGGMCTEGETPGQSYRRLRLDMLRAERAEVLDIRDSGGADHEVLAQVLDVLDLEESMLVAVGDRAQSARAAVQLVTPSAVQGECEHLTARDGRPDPAPSSTRCECCVAEGTTPVHLRICLDCGNVGCCDSSQGRHASRHHAETGHPVMRSFEPDEAWRWCFVDEQLG